MTDPTPPGSRILVADDDQSLVRTLTWILKEHGYEVAVCPGGEGLFAKLEEIKPALLLLDIMMPKVDGLQLLERLKQDERYRDLPVLMVSSMPPEEATVRAGTRRRRLHLQAVPGARAARARRSAHPRGPR